jgi:hypothetical protein
MSSSLGYRFIKRNCAKVLTADIQLLVIMDSVRSPGCKNTVSTVHCQHAIRATNLYPRVVISRSGRPSTLSCSKSRFRWSLGRCCQRCRTSAIRESGRFEGRDEDMIRMKIPLAVQLSRRTNLVIRLVLPTLCSPRKTSLNFFICKKRGGRFGHRLGCSVNATPTPGELLLTGLEDEKSGVDGVAMFDDASECRTYCLT